MLRFETTKLFFTDPLEQFNVFGFWTLTEDRVNDIPAKRFIIITHT